MNRRPPLYVDISPTMLQWAWERAHFTQEKAYAKVKQLADWMNGKKRPTFRQLEDFAQTFHVPFGYLLLEKPPTETLPLTDFRTPRSEALRRPSPDLMDVVYRCQDQQEWYANYLRQGGQPARPFVGSAKISDNPADVAADIRALLQFEVHQRQLTNGAEDSLNAFIDKAEAAGILVMIGGTVGSNTHRTLNPDEFRGFCLIDSQAPVVFVNGRDAKTAQLFTLAHELAHVWLGESALSDIEMQTVSGVHPTESWCNQVAAEVLVPRDVIMAAYNPALELSQNIQQLKKQFKVSTLVILKRLLDIQAIDKPTFKQFWQKEEQSYQEKAIKAKESNGGGDYYRTLFKRTNKRLVGALVIDTLEGHTTYGDAFRLLGIKTRHQLLEIARN
jgi:Zn-dependent peptidase ImmA (M78 family)